MSEFDKEAEDLLTEEAQSDETFTEVEEEEAEKIEQVPDEPEEEGPRGPTLSNPAWRRETEKEFFCEKRQVVVTCAECLDLFCFSNSSDNPIPGSVAPYDHLCKKCPVGKKLRRRLSSPLPSISNRASLLLFSNFLKRLGKRKKHFFD